MPLFDKTGLRWSTVLAMVQYTLSAARSDLVVNGLMTTPSVAITSVG